MVSVERSPGAPPVRPPIAPMLARLARTLPVGPGLRYEPKWDGFRCLAFRNGDDVDLRSRNQRPLARYFPEVVAALRARSTSRFVVDGELLILASSASDAAFETLMARLHPAATRVEQLAATTPATFVVFDLLADGERDVCDAPFDTRRAALQSVFTGVDAPDADAGALAITPVTDDAALAQRWLDGVAGVGGVAGVDGVVVKPADLRYQPGRRAMTKVKHQRTADCVVAGFRWLANRPAVSSLLLGLYDGDALRHVGVAASFAESRRVELLDALRPFVVALAEHPWAAGFGREGGAIGRLPGAASRWTPDLGLDWVPVRPELVCEVGYDQLEGTRFRHPARFVRWRPDRDARSCDIAQLSRS